VKAGRAENRRGQICGVIVCLAAIITGGTAAALGKETSGAILGTAGLASIAAVFVIGKRLKGDEDKDEGERGEKDGATKPSVPARPA